MLFKVLRFQANWELIKDELHAIEFGCNYGIGFNLFLLNVGFFHALLIESMGI